MGCEHNNEGKHSWTNITVHNDWKGVHGQVSSNGAG